MLLIALTGNIAAGKTTVADALARQGAIVVDADRAAHDAVAPGTAALEAIARDFGPELLQPDGSLDRARMGRLVFGDPTARRRLEAIVHPAVERERQAAVAAARAAGASLVVCDIPLLFEARLAWQFPRIILVDAPAAVRRNRLVNARGLRPDDAAARIAAQMPSALKRERADVVLDNGGTPEDLLRQLTRLRARLDQWSAVARTPVQP